MVAVTKEEKEAILRCIPDAYIIRTMKKKSKRHHYYCEEMSRVMSFLEDYRQNRGRA